MENLAFLKKQKGEFIQNGGNLVKNLKNTFATLRK
jgi:hypothetical protein